MVRTQRLGLLRRLPLAKVTSWLCTNIALGYENQFPVSSPLVKCVLITGTARQRIDSVMPGLLGADEAVRAARDDLQTRVGRSKRSASTASIISLPASLDAGLRRGSSILKMFSSKRTVVTGVPEASVPNPSAPQVPAHTRKMAMAAVLLEEWLQELAALAQEHSVLLQQEKILGIEERSLDNELETEGP